MSRHLMWRALPVISVIAASTALVAARPMRLGLDLPGGTQIVLEAQRHPAWCGRRRDRRRRVRRRSSHRHRLLDQRLGRRLRRIREQRRARLKERLADVADAACLPTITRAINTGLGALFILVALYFLGGETLTDFAFALIVGILVGTYSSVFTAAPLAVALENLSPSPVGPRDADSVGKAALRKPREEPSDAPVAALASSSTTSRKQATRAHAGPTRQEKEASQMMLQHFPARVILVGASVALMVIVLVDGWLLSVVEDLPWLQGVWIAFNVVSTIGFGTGPQSAVGQLIAMTAFAGAAVCWFCILLTAVELAQLRIQRSALIHEARRSLRSTAGGRLFNRN